MEVINALGRRKTSVARVYFSQGNGQFKVNDHELADYFPSEIFQIIIKQPLNTVNYDESYNIKVNVHGGGFKGQAEAIRLGLARILCRVNPEYRDPLKKAGYLTRDSRMVERKKYGKRKARRRFQFSKR